jgi:hypothetical protein
MLTMDISEIYISQTVIPFTKVGSNMVLHVTARKLICADIEVAIV